MSIRNLDRMFRPRSVAVFGASDKPKSVGSALMANLLRAGFSGPVLPVNPRAAAVHGIMAYKDVSSLPMTPDASRELDWLVIGLSLIAVVYIGFVALAQQDMKKLVAYSSIAHMGFVTLGSFIVFDIQGATGALSGAVMGLSGAMVQMISHGLISGALFFCVGVLYGLWNRLPCPLEV